MNNIRQLSVFLENRPGHLGQVCRALAGAGINIVTMTLADTTEFGIIRLIIREWREAKDILERAGFTVKATDVLAIEVADEPGGLEAVLRTAAGAGLSVEYMYAFARGTGNKAMIVICFDDPAAAAAALRTAGAGVISAEEFYSEKQK
ncbi:ACT domain-containing protein [Termitidicoccus mucosus]|uniref:Amino acid-binding protein n=1 Tax=Termitidicoccus mucosus TaxID=1184151 RepID=A0A178IEZ7_9BACT|nr:amino acid-binding protein [Opitutaceae bacterium TSB47]